MQRATVQAAALALVASAGVASAALIHVESFENAPGGSYTLSNQFDDGFFDFFGRYAVPEPAGGNAARLAFQNGWDGSFGIMGQDFDGDGFSPTQGVTMAGINISGFTGNSVTMSLGGQDSEAAGFNNFEIADGDGIRIYATIDAGVKTLIAAFLPPALSDNGGVNAGDLRLDTNGDGFGDGTRLTIDLADFTFAIGDGASLTLEIEMTSTSSFEMVAVDYIRVNGVPAPGALALLAFGGLAASRRRRS